MSRESGRALLHALLMSLLSGDLISGDLHPGDPGMET